MARIGVDVGGTHTDLVWFDEAGGGLTIHKVPSTPADPSRAAMDGLLQLCTLAGESPSAISYFMHGTTVATNIALEHNGARTGLITTEGFRDVLHIARHKRPQTFSLQLDLPWQRNPLVPRRWRAGVPERMVPPGEVLLPLDEDAVRRQAQRFAEQGIEAIAICFLHAYLNPQHELRAAQIIAEEMPDCFISMSHNVVAQYREYERFSTTALNAYVGPKTSAYLKRLSGTLEENGVAGDLHLMQSSGGSATLDAATQRPVNLLMSGPAGGLLGGIWVGKSAGFENVITLDVGGTSADIGVAPGGEVQFKHILDTRLGDYHAMVPMAEVDAIGAGGGSIAYVDPGGQFQVGPRSAGADPGPACYNRGGGEPTATDCMVALGRIDPSRFLGGKLPLRADLARSAIENGLSASLNQPVEEVALSAIRILTHNMVQAIEVNSVRRGLDPRDFALVAFGGGGPLFACDIARELAIPTIIVPPAPGLTSALGLLTSDVSYEISRTVMLTAADENSGAIGQSLDQMQCELTDQLSQDGFAPDAMRFLRFADCRYRGQGYELRTPVSAGVIDASAIDHLRQAFHQEHVSAYGRDFPDKDIQLVNLRVVGIGTIPKLEPLRIGTGGTVPDDDSQTAIQTCLFDTEGTVGAHQTPRFERSLLLAGNRLSGPAIVDQMDTTTVIPPGFAAEIDGFGNIVITVQEGLS